MAALPFFLKRKYGFKYITMPLLCKMMGPYLLPIYRTIEHEHKLFEALIVQLPEVDRFVQDFHFTYQNWLPFYWKGYQQTTRYTYLIPRLGDLTAVWTGIYRSYRNNIIPKAKELLTVRTDLSLEVFLRCTRRPLIAKASKCLLALNTFHDWTVSLTKRNAVKSFSQWTRKKMSTLFST